MFVLEKMSEPASKPVTSLAITERPERSGNCVGIFFQLFDWKRRLAKKKLFSKKLFPPRGDEKLPAAKFLLIAGENRGGFPNSKKAENNSVCSLADAERSNGMKTPGLVARLMGLESMPAVRRDKPKKAPVSEFCYRQERKPIKHVDNLQKKSEFFCYDRDLNSEKGQAKVDLRPQKLQKTGFFDRRSVTKVGAEALQFKNALSRSKKQHHRLASPVKSPRILSGRNAVRLMEAASKILEPGLQATNQAKYSLTYSTSPCLSLEDQATREREFPLKQTRQPTYPFSAKSQSVQPSCNSCGNFLSDVDFRLNVEEQATDGASSSSDFNSSELSHASSHGSGKGRLKSRKTSLAHDGGVDVGRSVFSRHHEGVVSLAGQAKANVQKKAQNLVDRRLHIQRDQDLFPPVRECKPQLVVNLNALKQKNQNKRGPSADAVNRTKDYVALNRNLSGQTTKMRTPTRVVDNCKMNVEKTVWDKKDDSFSTVKTLARKRRPVNSSTQFMSTGFSNSNIVKQESVTSGVNHRTGSEVDVRSLNRNSMKTTFQKKAEGHSMRNGKDADIVSFAFSSPMRHGIGSSSSLEMNKRRNQSELPCSISHQGEANLNKKTGNSPPPRISGLHGDALGALLGQKLRELTFLNRDKSMRPLSQENGDNCSDGFSSKDSLYNDSPESLDCTHAHDQLCSPSRKFQAEAKKEIPIKFLPHANDCDHPSPTSILEASFSNDSFLSECLSGRSGHKLDHQSIECSHHQTQAWLPKTGLLDSTTSMNTRMARIEKLNSICSTYGIDPSEIGLTGIKLYYAREIIWNVELLCGNLSQYDYVSADTLVDSLLLDMLEALVKHQWGRPKCNLGFPDTEEGHLFRGFLFDCMVECLDSRYSGYFTTSFMALSKLPLSTNRENLAREVFEQIKQWRNLAKKDLDDMVEMEMSNSSGKWTEFKNEAFDTGVDIEGDILQILLDEMVVDLGQCWVGCF